MDDKGGLPSGEGRARDGGEEERGQGELRGWVRETDAHLLLGNPVARFLMQGLTVDPPYNDGGTPLGDISSSSCTGGQIISHIQ